MNRLEKKLLREQVLRQQIVEANLSRREMLKMGLLTAGGLLIPSLNSQAQTIDDSAGVSNGMGSSIAGPRIRPFINEMPIPPTAQPVSSLPTVPTETSNTAAGEGRTRDHQALKRYPPQKLYDFRFQQNMQFWHTDLPPGPVWSPVCYVNGAPIPGITMPGPMLYMRYGEPVLVRMRNDLPYRNLGFGINSISTHLHNGHTPSESDGFPGDFYPSGQWYDHHYPNCYAGIDTYGSQYAQTHGADGDFHEALGTLWYHDHRQDFTAQNVYAGMLGMAPIFDNIDSGDEHDANPLALRLPSGKYDVPLIFGDKVFDLQGRLFFDLFDFNGIIGKYFTVNGVVQPYFRVERRKYRFRLLNGGPSRFYWWWMSDNSPFTMIANDGNLLPHPVQIQSFKQGVAERFDVVIDFSRYATGQAVYLVNRAEQVNGRGPTGGLLSPGTPVVRFIVGGLPAEADVSRVPADLRPLPDLAELLREVVQERTFVFKREQGSWTVNGALFDVNTVTAAPKKGTAEIWNIVNGGGDWSHPVHIHFEEHRFLSYNGAPPAPFESGRKDVIRLDPNANVRVAMRFRDFEGRYPAHCHNVVHEDHSMMFRWDIVP